MKLKDKESDLSFNLLKAELAASIAIKSEDYLVAGGAPRSIYTNQLINDIDVYYKIKGMHKPISLDQAKEVTENVEGMLDFRDKVEQPFFVNLCWFIKDMWERIVEIFGRDSKVFVVNKSKEYSHDNGEFSIKNVADIVINKDGYQAVIQFVQYDIYNPEFHFDCYEYQVKSVLKSFALGISRVYLNQRAKVVATDEAKYDLREKKITIYSKSLSHANALSFVGNYLPKIQAKYPDHRIVCAGVPSE